jgi:hypothetical protein
MAVAGGIGLADVTAETLADSLAYAADIAQAEAIVTVSDLAMVQPTVYESPVLYMPEYLPQNPIAWDYYNFPGGKPWEEPGRRRELLWPLMDTSWIGSGRLGSMEEVFPLGALWSDPFGLLKTAKGRKKRKR